MTISHFTEETYILCRIGSKYFIHDYHTHTYVNIYHQTLSTFHMYLPNQMTMTIYPPIYKCPSLLTYLPWVRQYRINVSVRSGIWESLGYVITITIPNNIMRLLLLLSLFQDKINVDLVPEVQPSQLPFSFLPVQ